MKIKKLWSQLKDHFNPQNEEIKYKEFLNAILESPKKAIPMLKADPNLSKYLLDNLDQDKNFYMLILNKTSSQSSEERYSDQEFIAFNKIKNASTAYVKSMLYCNETTQSWSEEHLQFILGDDSYIGAKY